jgi:hypothetical protein
VVGEADFLANERQLGGIRVVILCNFQCWGKDWGCVRNIRILVVALSNAHLRLVEPRTVELSFTRCSAGIKTDEYTFTLALE